MDENYCYIFNEKNRLLHFDLLKMRSFLSVETSVTNYAATYFHITEERVCYLYRCENLKTRVTV